MILLIYKLKFCYILNNFSKVIYLFLSLIVYFRKLDNLVLFHIKFFKFRIIIFYIDSLDMKDFLWS